MANVHSRGETRKLEEHKPVDLHWGEQVKIATKLPATGSQPVEHGHLYGAKNDCPGSCNKGK